MTNTHSPTSQPGAVPQPSTDALITGLLAAINSNSRQSLLEFLRNHAVLPSSSPMTLDDCADWLASFARLTQGLVLREIKPVDVTHLTQTALVDDRLYCAAHRMHLRFDALAGSKIIEIDFGPGEMRSVAMSKADGLAQIRSYCDQGALTDVFSGTVLVARGSDVLFEYACGAANKRYDVPNNLDTRFNLGSANKMFTAVAIAQLVERGRLSFTDSIDRYIDDSWLPASVTSGITVHHLLSHTSGLGSYFNETFFNGSRARFRAIDDFKPLVRDDRPAFTPGERFEYSNTGMLLAGVIIERVSGKSYYDYIREAIYAPCLMQDTDCYDIDAPVPNLAMGYIPLMDAMTGQTKPRTAAGWRENIFEHVAKGGPAGGGYSTVRDLHRFATALVAGELVGPAMREALWTDYTGSGYGYGFEVGRTATKTTIGHGGGFAGISASFEVTLETGRIAIVLSNYEAGTFGLARCIGHTLDQMEP